MTLALNSFSSVLATGLLFPVLGFSHGEDKLGPNGGFIRMPGAYHTELKAYGPSSFQVLLLDMNWKNPTIKDSSVAAVLKVGKESHSLVCKVSDMRFDCILPKGKDLSKGRLEIQSTREKQKGNVAVYELPLKLSKPAAAGDGHGGHSGH